MTNETNATGITLKEAAAAYVEHMRAQGQSSSTLGTIERTLRLLQDEMGEEKELAKILTVHVDKFFKSGTATMQPGRDGAKPRAAASILQIRRIVRMALVWWHEQGWIERLPLPATERKFTEKHKMEEDADAQAGRVDDQVHN